MNICKHKHLGECEGEEWRVSEDREFSISGGPGFISTYMKTARLKSGSFPGILRRVIPRLVDFSFG